MEKLKSKNSRKNREFSKKLVQRLYKKILKNQIIFTNYDLLIANIIYFKPILGEKLKRTNPVRFYFYNFFLRNFSKICRKISKRNGKKEKILLQFE